MIKSMESIPKKKSGVIQTLSVLLSRAKLMAGLGYQYEGDRNIYEALGYKDTLEYTDYALRYERQDIAAAVINRPVDASWRGGFKVEEIIAERKENEQTIFEKEWEELEDALSISSKLLRIDRLAGIGHYGILLLGLDDVKNSLDFMKPINIGKRNLLYIKPLSEGNATIASYNRNINDPRYAMPETYTIEIADPEGTKTSSLTVHHTRIIHILPGISLESEIYGMPRLKDIYNRLMDIEKIVGGSAEMFWRGARPGYQGKVDENYQLNEPEEDDLQDQLDEYEHNLRRILIMRGIDLNALQTQVVDPSKHLDIQIQMISATKKIPKRILTGSEKGELASSGDRDNWLEASDIRRKDYINPYIIYPFIDKCIEYNILSKPKLGYNIVWSDLFAQGDRDKAEIGKIRSSSVAEYSKNPLSKEILPLNSFYRHGLALSEEDIEKINQEKMEMIIEEENDFNAEDINVQGESM